MVRLLKLILLVAVAVSLVCAAPVSLPLICTSASHGVGAAAFASPPATAARVVSSTTAALQAELRRQTALATARIAGPGRWSAPALRAVIQVLRRDRQGAELYTRSGSAEPSADAICGSYAACLPNQIGEPSPDGRLSGEFLRVHLTSGFSLGQQHSQNIALVQGPPSVETIGSFLLRRESSAGAGWYLITLHLANPTAGSYRIRNRVFCMTGTLEGFPLVDDTRTLRPHETMMLPTLREWGASAKNWRRLLWGVEITGTSGSPAVVAFRGLTVDKL